MTHDPDAKSPRRRFLVQLAAAAAAFTASPLTSAATTTTGADDSLRDGDAWMKPLRGKHRQFFHAMGAAETPMLMASNFLDSYRDTFGAKAGDVHAVIGVHGGALSMGFGDDLWKKFELGKSGNISDPLTKEPATRNIFSGDGNLSIPTLQKRGVLFLMCNTALRLRTQMMSKSLNVPYDALYAELSGGRLPGVILVPALVVAMSRAQERGFGYIRSS